MLADIGPKELWPCTLPFFGLAAGLGLLACRLLRRARATHLDVRGLAPQLDGEPVPPQLRPGQTWAWIGVFVLALLAFGIIACCGLFLLGN
jgi:hypothetical protein